MYDVGWNGRVVDGRRWGAAFRGIINAAQAQSVKGLSFLQISDSHVADKPANPNAIGTLEEATKDQDITDATRVHDPYGRYHPPVETVGIRRRRPHHFAITP